jgi:hypothetical protein
MRGSRGAQARYPGGRRLLDGRAHFVWLHGVLVRLAIGEGTVEIRRRSPDGPWHAISATPEEALAEIERLFPTQRALLRNLRGRQAGRAEVT